LRVSETTRALGEFLSANPCVRRVRLRVDLYCQFAADMLNTFTLDGAVLYGGTTVFRVRGIERVIEAKSMGARG
jgi:hypothetical protein